MFNLSFGELLILGIIGLLVLGPKQLPRVAKILGRTLGDLKRSINEATSAVTSEMRTDIFAKQNKNIIAPEANPAPDAAQPRTVDLRNDLPEHSSPKTMSIEE